MNLLIDGIKDRHAEAMHEIYGFPNTENIISVNYCFYDASGIRKKFLLSVKIVISTKTPKQAIVI